MIHLRLDIAGAIKNMKTAAKNAPTGFTHDDGSHATNSQAIKFLEEKLRFGYKYLPMGDCPTFDYELGCKCEVKE